MAIIRFNEGQAVAAKKLNKWYHSSDQDFIIQGPAGSGKTSIIFKCIDDLGLNLRTEVLFITFVGKATLAMRRNGLNARTVHSSLYEMEEEYLYDDYGMVKKNSRGQNIKTKHFIKREMLSPKIKLIVVDEAAMIPEQMMRDIYSFGIKIVALGDIYQLPPVFGKSSFLNNPDAVLTEIVRQQAGNPILRLAEAARLGIDIPPNIYGPRCIVIEEDLFKYSKLLVKPSLLICGKNATRNRINDMVRYDIKKFKSELPQYGDKMVCRKNNWDEVVDDIPLINGLFGYVENVYQDSFNGKSINIDFRPEFMDDYFEHLPVDYQYLKTPFEEKKHYMYGEGNRFEYGYASTCHLAQGSQYNYVMVLEEQIGSEDFHKKWLYTAITRATTSLVIFKKKKKKQFYFW